MITQFGHEILPSLFSPFPGHRAFHFSAHGTWGLASIGTGTGMADWVIVIRLH